MRVVIMGGTAGIGLATARTLLADGAEVTITGRDPQRLAEAAEAGLRTEALDSTSETDVAAFFEEFGEFEHLVLAFSPGAIGFGPLSAVTYKEIRAAFDGKILPYLYAIQQAKVTGSITLLSASSARSALAGAATLAAVNGGIERMVSPLAVELAPVRVNAVAPGAVDTDWWSFLSREQKEAQFDAVAESLPAGRIGHPEDVAEAIRYAIGATYVTGSVLKVDGGFTVA